MNKTRKITFTALMCAMAFIATFICRIKIMPGADFLTYDPKDVIVAISGFIMGPVESLYIALITSFLEMITLSDTGIIGMMMNVVSSLSFAFTASLIYKFHRKIGGAVASLVLATVCQSAMMILWNWAITPIYMGIARDAVVQMIVPVFLPFNIIKGAINSALALLLYNPIINAFERLGVITNHGQKKKPIIWIIIPAIIVIGVCVAVVTVLR